MPTNQRKNARKERSRKNEAKTRKIIWAVLIFVIIVLIIMRVCEIDFASLKNRFTDANGNFTLSLVTDENEYPLSIDSSKDVSVNVVSDKLNVLTDVSYSVYNPATAKKLYSFNHGYANPILKCAGTYNCLYDQGSYRLRLDTNKENVYETTAKKPILAADVSKKGVVIYATRGDKTKSKLFVYDKSLKKKAEIDVNDGYIVSVAIDPSGKKLAYAVVNSKNATFTTTVFTQYVSDEKSTASFSYPNTSVLSLKFANSSDLYFVGTDTVSVISSLKNKTDVHKNGSISTLSYCYTDDNELVVAYSDYENASNGKVEYIRPSGNVKTMIKLDKKAKYISSSSNEICVLYNDGVDVFSLTKGERNESYKCDDSVTSVHKLSSRVYASHQKVIDLLDKQ